MSESDSIGNKTAIIKTTLAEYTKSHQAFDGSGRLEYLYQAGVDTANGKPCYAVRYSYIGSTTNVNYIKEYQGVWDSSWETF